jgi:hypothetical protein
MEETVSSLAGFRNGSLFNVEMPFAESFQNMVDRAREEI